ARAAIERMRRIAPGAEPTLPLVMPTAGAALLALDGAEIPVDHTHFQILRASGQSWHTEELYAL
ncbi:MAG: hypothetical protein ACRDG4_13945, partial [Chloroflexota bacterium]